ncbi:MAG: hypothetical protein ACI85U_001146 [Candidatus Promineifilaceae bacterium]|jgi:hypothetical protein
MINIPQKPLAYSFIQMTSVFVKNQALWDLEGEPVYVGVRHFLLIL